MLIFHGLVQTLWENIHGVVAVDQAWLFGRSRVFLRVECESLTARKR